MPGVDVHGLGVLPAGDFDERPEGSHALMPTELLCGQRDLGMPLVAADESSGESGPDASDDRATRPGGRLAFVCWQPLIDNEWLLVPGAALAEHVALPDLGSSDVPGMFALSGAERVHEVLTAAGWNGVTIDSRHASMLVGGGGTLDETVEFLLTGSMGRTLLAGVDSATEARAVASVRAALTPRADDSGVHLDAAVWLVQATA